MKTKLNFEDKSTKELLSKLDFEYFLKQNFEVEKYSSKNIKELYLSYQLQKKKLKNKSKTHKTQFHYFIEGKVRKMFTGGLLPAMFELDEGRRHQIFDFASIGENWAYFEYWKKSYNRILKKEKIWNNIVKTGSVLAFILTILKLYEILIKTE